MQNCDRDNCSIALFLNVYDDLFILVFLSDNNILSACLVGKNFYYHQIIKDFQIAKLMVDTGVLFTSLKKYFLQFHKTEVFLKTFPVKYRPMKENGLEQLNLIQMTTVSTTVGKNPLKGMEQFWGQSQKLQNDNCFFPRQTIDCRSNLGLCSNQYAEKAEAEQF